MLDCCTGCFTGQAGGRTIRVLVDRVFIWWVYFCSERVGMSESWEVGPQFCAVCVRVGSGRGKDALPLKEKVPGIRCDNGPNSPRGIF